MPLNLFDDLNESQREAVTYCDGPSLVIAGAGSGKTRVLTYKIAYLLENGYEPWSILALTFTNKAAREMNERIAALVGGERAKYLWSGTFHSIFGRILRAEAPLLGFTSSYTIYDQADQRSLLKSIIREMGLNDDTYKPAAVAGRISEAKNRLVGPEQYAASAEVLRRDRNAGLGETFRIYERYVKRCHGADAMDFDDLLTNTYALFRDHPDIRRKYADRFRYILVDEYQDTNFAQHCIITQLAAPDARICVVGDDAQSIYGFRGANIDNILRFNQQYPTTRTIKLECNYRSTRNIVNAANCIIRHNKNQIPKKIYTDNGEGERLHLFGAYSDREESMKAATEIARLHNLKNVGYEEIALLYRTNAQSRSFEETLRNNSIPYRIIGGQSFYQRKEIKDIIAYLRLINNPHDEEAFKRILNYPARGIGETTRSRILAAAVEQDSSPWDVLEKTDELTSLVNRAAAKKLQLFRSMIEDFRIASREMPLYDLVIKVIKESGIFTDLQKGEMPEDISRRENVEELLNAIKTFEADALEEFGVEMVPLGQYLSQVALLTDADQRDDGLPKVTLMTVHAAKGLEFDAVFVTGLEEDLFPSGNARFSPREMEEERRLFYVAVTRAKKYCYLSYAKSRYRYGRLEFCNPSPFLDEISPEYIEREGTTPAATQRFAQNPNGHTSSIFGNTRTPSSLKRIPSRNDTAESEKKLTSAGDFSVGQEVEHERFGIGKIISIEGSGDSIKVKVDFQHAGSKNLLLKYARLKPCP